MEFPSSLGGSVRVEPGKNPPPHVPGHPVLMEEGWHGCAGLDEGVVHRAGYVNVAWTGQGPMHAPVWWDPKRKVYASSGLRGRVLMRGWWVHLGPTASTPKLATVYVP